MNNIEFYLNIYFVNYYSINIKMILKKKKKKKKQKKK